MQRPSGPHWFEQLKLQSQLTSRLEAMVLELRSVRGGAQKKLERLRQELAMADGIAALTVCAFSLYWQRIKV